MSEPVKRQFTPEEYKIIERWGAEAKAGLKKLSKNDLTRVALNLLLENFLQKLESNRNKNETAN
jgi:hypothetical protein